MLIDRTQDKNNNGLGYYARFTNNAVTICIKRHKQANNTESWFNPNTITREIYFFRCLMTHKTVIIGIFPFSCA